MTRSDPTAEAVRIAAATPYPPAPWTMEGVWMFSIHPVRRSLAAANLPAPLRPLWLPAGRTLGWSFISQYGPGSTLEYQEAACGLVLRRGARPALWISGLVVDSPSSVAGGRNLWGLPKELADIAWSSPERDRASAAQGGGLLLSFEGVPDHAPGLPYKLGFDALTVADGKVKRIPASFDGRIGITRRLRPFFPASGAWSAFGVSGYSISGLGRGVATFGQLEDA